MAETSSNIVFFFSAELFVIRSRSVFRSIQQLVINKATGNKSRKFSGVIENLQKLLSEQAYNSFLIFFGSKHIFECLSFTYNVHDNYMHTYSYANQSVESFSNFQDSQ